MESKNLDLQFELKVMNDKTGEFEGLASPYMNVDNGNDRVMPTIAKANEGRDVPYLWQHDTEKIIGKAQMYNSDLGIMIKGKLFLELIPDTQTPQVPKAHEAYANMKAGLLANSIGYVVKENGSYYDKQGVRNLTDIVIKEVSAVTFAMNEQAKITSVKNDGGEKVEEKNMNPSYMMDMMKQDDMMMMKMPMLMAGLNDSMYKAMMDGDMCKMDRMDMMNSNIDDFMKMYRSAATDMMNKMPDDMMDGMMGMMMKMPMGDMMEMMGRMPMMNMMPMMKMMAMPSPMLNRMGMGMPMGMPNDQLFRMGMGYSPYTDPTMGMMNMGPDAMMPSMVPIDPMNMMKTATEFFQSKAGAKFSKATKAKMMKLCTDMMQSADSMMKMMEGTDAMGKSTDEDLEQKNDDALVNELELLSSSMKGDN